MQDAANQRGDCLQLLFPVGQMVWGVVRGKNFLELENSVFLHSRPPKPPQKAKREEYTFGIKLET